MYDKTRELQNSARADTSGLESYYSFPSILKKVKAVLIANGPTQLLLL